MTRVLFTVIAFILSFANAVEAQGYPSRPIRFVVANGPGSSQDIIARIVSQPLAEQLGQQIVVDVRPGGSGIIGVEIVKAAAPDGYTILLAATTQFAALPVLKSNLSYDAEKDFSPLTRIASVANVMAVYPGLNIANVEGLVKLARSRPGKLNYGSAGNGSSGHMAGAMFSVLAGVDMVHVPYKGAAQALTDLIAGQIHMTFSGPLVIMPHARSGRIRVIATTGAQRDPLIPELPAVSETLPGYEVTQWFGIAVPSMTPAAVANKLHAEILKVLQRPAIRDQLAKRGARAQPEQPAEFAQFIRGERSRVATLAKRANIRIE